MSGVVVLILKEILPMVIGPLVTEVVKWLSKRYGSTLPAIVKIMVSATAGGGEESNGYGIVAGCRQIAAGSRQN